MDVPKDWDETVRRPPRDLPPTIVLTSSGLRGSKLLVTVLWDMKHRPDFPSEQHLKEMVEANGATLLPTAVEKELVLEQLRGTDHTGWFFRLTDRQPKPGEFEYVVSGGIVVRDLLLSFTLLSHERDSVDVRAALAALASAR